MRYSPKFGDLVTHKGVSKAYAGDQAGWITLVNSDGTRDLVLPSEIDSAVTEAPQVTPVTVPVTPVTPIAPEVPKAPKTAKTPKVSKGVA